MWWRKGLVVASAIAVAVGFVVIGAAAGRAGQRSPQMMVEGSVGSVSQGSFDLLVQERPYCPAGVMCPLFLTRPTLYRVRETNVTIFSPSGMRLSASDLRPGVQVVVSGQDAGKDQIAAGGVLLMGTTSGFCDWPYPGGPSCPAPPSVTGP